MVKGNFVSANDKKTITDAIRNAEAKTSGEIVTVIAREADDYRFIALFWAAIVALAFPGFILMTSWNLDYLRLYEVQAILFFLLAITFNLRPIKMLIVPSSIKKMRAHRLAKEQFFLQGLHNTVGRTGILLFVSVAERHVEIIADKGINDCVEHDRWTSTVDSFVSDVRAQRIVEGFVTAVTRIGEILQQRFPAEAKNPNELPDHLVELD